MQISTLNKSYKPPTQHIGQNKTLKNVFNFDMPWLNTGFIFFRGFVQGNGARMTDGENVGTISKRILVSLPPSG
jgi:hypothetical protein